MDLRKLRDYCLNPAHPRGRQKARVFASALDLGADDATELRDALLFAARSDKAYATERDEHGQRYILDFDMVRKEGTARVRSSWILRSGEDFPRLTSCYVL